MVNKHIGFGINATPNADGTIYRISKLIDKVLYFEDVVFDKQPVLFELVDMLYKEK